jgi:long-chain acyl-CoA synthetase
MRLCHLVARLLIGLRVSGVEHIPDNGPCIICPNHQSYLDAFLLVGALPYRVFRQLFYVGASEYFNTHFMAKLATMMKVVPVDPDANLVRAMQAGAFGLRHGRILVLFPEGERSPDGAPKKFKKGAAILAHQLHAPILPATIDGFEGVWPRGSGLRCRRLLPWASTRSSVEFGGLLRPEDALGTADEDRYTHLTGHVRRAVLTAWERLHAANQPGG